MARKTGILLVYAMAAAASLMLLGFIVFASSASRPLQSVVASKPGDLEVGRQIADGIVVLTGAKRRIEAGIELLRNGHAARLLISGVNRRVTPDEVLRLNSKVSLSEGCCIDFGYDALDTIGNASETRAWAGYHRFSRLIIVTSSYHMPRSLNELAVALPGVELIAHPLVPRMLSERPWWLNAHAMRLLASEYVKLLPSYARYVAFRLLPAEPRTMLPSDPQTRSQAAALGP